MVQISEREKQFYYYFAMRQQLLLLNSYSKRFCRFEPFQYRMVLKFQLLSRLMKFLLHFLF